MVPWRTIGALVRRSKRKTSQCRQMGDDDDRTSTAKKEWPVSCAIASTVSPPSITSGKQNITTTNFSGWSINAPFEQVGMATERDGSPATEGVFMLRLALGPPFTKYRSDREKESSINPTCPTALKNRDSSLQQNISEMLSSHGVLHVKRSSPPCMPIASGSFSFADFAPPMVPFMKRCWCPHFLAPPTE